MATTLFVATLLGVPFEQLNIKVDLIYDSLVTQASWEDFVKIAIQRNWFYAPTAEKVLNTPLHVHALENSVERSMLGLFFIAIEEQFQVPMKGKYFTPFIQFYLADLIKSENIYSFPSELNLNDISGLKKILLSNQKVITFLQSKLLADAPESLKKFLDDL
jgi:hypothetical protein